MSREQRGRGGQSRHKNSDCRQLSRPFSGPDFVSFRSPLPTAMAEEVPPDADAAASFADDVGASVIVEAGATSGTLTLPASAMKFADLTESGSESGDNGSGEPGTSAAATGGRSSPPPNCAICLSRCHRKCFTDSCMHQFCFKCLCEWSKVSRRRRVKFPRNL